MSREMKRGRTIEKVGRKVRRIEARVQRVGGCKGLWREMESGGEI